MTSNAMAVANRKKDKRSTKHYTENNVLDNNIPPHSLSWLDIGNSIKQLSGLN
jgi:hypothetical protein